MSSPTLELLHELLQEVQQHEAPPIVRVYLPRAQYLDLTASLEAETAQGAGLAASVEVYPSDHIERPLIDEAWADGRRTMREVR